MARAAAPGRRVSGRRHRGDFPARAGACGDPAVDRPHVGDVVEVHRRRGSCRWPGRVAALRDADRARTDGGDGAVLRGAPGAGHTFARPHRRIARSASHQCCRTCPVFVHRLGPIGCCPDLTTAISTHAGHRCLRARADRRTGRFGEDVATSHHTRPGKRQQPDFPCPLGYVRCPFHCAQAGTSELSAVQTSIGVIMSRQPLLERVRLGPHELRNRIVMAPMTRSRAVNPGHIPTDLHAEYYAQRAAAGLIVSEATQVSPQGIGYIHTPGIHSAAQITGWSKVTQAVHEAGGRIFAQLWHVGRISHPDFHDGELPVAPSAINPESMSFTAEGWQATVTPRALETAEIPGGFERRSEEHTSELQSRGQLVCRLLLEKKYITETTHTKKTGLEYTSD